MERFKLKDQFLNIFPPICFFIVTFCIFMPCSLFLGNIDEFPIEFEKIIPLVCAVSLMVFILLTGIGFLFSGKGKKINHIYMGVVFSCALGFYLQGNFLNPHFGVLNGNTIDWSKYSSNGFVSILVWILCITIPQIFLTFQKKRTMCVIKWSSYFAAAMQMVTIVILAFTSEKTVENDFVITKDKQFQLSEQENIILFVVDSLDASWFEDIILSDETYRENLQDFTYFDNVVSGGAPTVLGIPLILTGKPYDTTVSLDEYHKDAYGNASLFQDLQKNNFDVRLYTDYSLLNGADRKNINNLEEGQEYKISSYQGFTKQLYQLVSFYAMPQIFKQYFWINSDDFSNFISVSENNIDMYQLDDPQFYKDYINQGLKKDNERKVFAMYHLYGAHPPYTMNENCELTDMSETSRDQQIRGAMKIVFEIISKMKEIGIYDHSTIFITADHGGMQLYQNPAVLVKTKDTKQKFCKNANPATFENLHASIAASFLDDYSDYGKSLFEVNDVNVQRLHTAAHSFGEVLFPENEIVEANSYTRFVIPNDARDIDGVEVYDGDLKNVVEYNMGDVLRFTTQEEWFRQIKTGIIKDTSDSGCGIVGNTFEMTFQLADYHNKDIAFSFEYGNVFKDKQTVEIHANDELLMQSVCVQESANKAVSVVIPSGYAKNQKLDIKLKLPDAARPSDSDSESGDHRKLSISLISMKLEET